MKKCLNCHEDFEPNSGKQKFCSDKCKVAFSRKSKKSPTEKITILTPHEVTKFNKEYAEKINNSQSDFTLSDSVVKPYFDNELSWIKEVEEYYNKSGISPQDLIDAHRNQNSLKSAKKQGKEVKVQDLTKPPNSNWRKEYIKNKTGITSLK